MKESMLDFMGYGPHPPGARPSTECWECKAEGKKVTSDYKFTWWEKLAGFFWGKRKIMQLIEEDPYCDTYECEECGRRWRTMKEVRHGRGESLHDVS